MIKENETTSGDVAKVDKPLGKVKKRKKMKVNLTADLQEQIQNDVESSLQVAMLKRQDQLTEASVKEAFSHRVDEVNEGKDEEDQVTVDYAELAKGLNEDESETEKLYNKLHESFTKIEGLEDEQSEEIFSLVETIVQHAVKNLSTQLEEAFQDAVNDEKESIVAEQNEKFEVEISTFVSEKAEEIKTANENTKSTEVLKAILEKLAELDVDVEADEESEVSKLQEEVDTLKTDKEEADNALLEANKKLLSYKKAEILAEVSEGLTELDKDKLAEFAEDIVYIDEEKYKGKLEKIKSTFLEESTTEEVEDEDEVDEGKEKGISLKSLISDSVRKTNK